MSKKSKLVNPVAAAVGIAFVSSLAMSANVMADDNPFSTADLGTGYQVAGDKGKEGSCGEKGDKDKEGACGEGKCGASMGAKDTPAEKGKEGSCGEKGKEGSCGEKGKEGSCGGDA